VAGLFQDWNPFEWVASNQFGSQSSTLGRGSLIAFEYPVSHAKRPNIIHDPYPLLIVTDIWPQYVRGVNLHYLTFPYIKRVLTSNCNNKIFSYYNVRPDKYLASAFRMYYRTGMSRIRVMDCQFLVQLLNGIRSWSESEIERVRLEIRQQIRQRLQAKANELANLNKNQYEQMRREAADIQQAVRSGALDNLTVLPSARNPANFNADTGPFEAGDMAPNSPAGIE
jgi:hypothetical protein